MRHWYVYCRYLFIVYIVEEKGKKALYLDDNHKLSPFVYFIVKQKMRNNQFSIYMNITHRSISLRMLCM